MGLYKVIALKAWEIILISCYHTIELVQKLSTSGELKIKQRKRTCTCHSRIAKQINQRVHKHSSLDNSSLVLTFAVYLELGSWVGWVLSCWDYGYGINGGLRRLGYTGKTNVLPIYPSNTALELPPIPLTYTHIINQLNSYKQHTRLSDKLWLYKYIYKHKLEKNHLFLPGPLSIHT